MDIKIIVATHKEYRMPDDPIYLPVQVGAAISETDLGYMPDNTGDNISSKNKNYCELTALYWAWKNLDADCIGLTHYRRHFSHKRKGGKWESVLTGEEARELCSKHSVIVPNKRRYYIETIHSHYIHAHNKEGADVLADVIKKSHPDYVPAYETVMNRTWAHMFNMFILRRDVFDRYCRWLFDVLFEVEGKLDISGWSEFEARVFGRLSELMLDVFLIKNDIEYCERPVMYMENQNWFIKGGAFVWRKVKRA